tara:strand:- start:594 stop:1646 length:1053 start_codon:yes stop_codon:yes gene_type:complete
MERLRVNARIVELSSKVVSIPSRYFTNWVNLKIINLYHILGFFRLPESLFLGCTSLEQITLPESLETIGSKCFKDCKSLETIDLPNRVSSIGREAFMGCEKLKEVNIPKSLDKIDVAVFNGCSSLRTMSLSSRVNEILGAAFSNCINFQYIYIDPNVYNVAIDAFTNTSAEFVIDLGNHSSVTWSTLLLSKYTELPKRYTCIWQDYKFIGTPEFMKLSEHEKKDDDEECYGDCIKHTRAKLENKKDVFYTYQTRYSLQDKMKIDLIFATLDGTEYSIPKEEFYNEYSLKEHLVYLYPDELKNSEEFDLLFHCDEESVQDATPSQMFEKIFHRDNSLDLKEPIMIIWRKTK